MPFLYILECADGTYYTGSTWRMDKLFWEHNNFLGANYTKKRQPVKLVFCQEFYRMDEAYFREKQVQGWSHAKKKALIEKSFQLLPELARSKK